MVAANFKLEIKMRSHEERAMAAHHHADDMRINEIRHEQLAIELSLGNHDFKKAARHMRLALKIADKIRGEEPKVSYTQELVERYMDHRSGFNKAGLQLEPPKP